jgi:phosphoribosylformylglycinamidine synthase PurS subunit
VGTVAGSSHQIEVRVELKPEVADAEADSIARSLQLLGIPLKGLRTARLFDLTFEGVDAEEALRRANEAVERLLANPVIHRVSVRPLPG